MTVSIHAGEVGAIQTVVVVAGYKNLVLIRQIAKPVDEIIHFVLTPGKCKIAGMYDDIRRRHLQQLAVPPVSVGDMQQS
jgi:hypothetical protein